MKYGATQAEALRAFDAGVPVLLPRANRWRDMMLNHRWGDHGEKPDERCPACKRDAAEAALDDR